MDSMYGRQGTNDASDHVASVPSFPLAGSTVNKPLSLIVHLQVPDVPLAISAKQ
jgi:hypothetical protein